MVKVEFKRLYDDSILPKKAHETDAGFDLYAHTGQKNQSSDQWLLNPGEQQLVKCGFAMSMPAGYEAQVRPRSGLALKYGISITNSPGTIDCSYKMEVGVILLNTSPHDSFVFKRGDRIAQLVINKLPEVETVEVEEFSNNDDRGGGFGSSGT